MGCDIHVYLERRVEGEWRAVRPPSDWNMYAFMYRWEPEIAWEQYEWDVERNYSLFGRLAGVRSRSEEPIVYPRGLPADVDKPVREAIVEWGRDAHTSSWLADFELARVEWADLSEQFPRLVEEVRRRSPARIVFWFDN